MRVMLLLPLVAFGALAQPAAPAPPTVTLEDLARACAKGDLVSCTDYGFNLEAPDPEKAVTVYRAACAKDALPACSNLALMLRDARGAPKNLVEAAKVAKKACDGGNAPGCLHLALVKDAANDFEAASAAYEHACTLKVLPACTNYAINVLKGVGVKKDEKRALTLLEKSCGDSVKKGAAFPSLRACVVLGRTSTTRAPWCRRTRRPPGASTSSPALAGWKRAAPGSARARRTPTTTGTTTDEGPHRSARRGTFSRRARRPNVTGSMPSSTAARRAMPRWRTRACVSASRSACSRRSLSVPPSPGAAPR